MDYIQLIEYNKLCECVLPVAGEKEKNSRWPPSRWRRENDTAVGDV